MSIPNSSVIVEGHAIVSVDGMIAAADGSMPPALRNEADWRIFQAALDAAALVVLGRLGHERHPNPGRKRLVLTRSVATLERDPADALTQFWNPAGLDIGEVLTELGISDGTIAIT
ncbi:MAG: dihydrofolate reductase, partial [Devosia sp.]|nr:dihydrofolate reductase [Devosia sp.]